MNQQTAPSGPAHVARPVHGLEHIDGVARSHRRSRRRANAAKTAAVMIIAVAAVGTAGYFAWAEFLRDEPATTPTRGPLTPTEAIEVLEEQPLWNGPGAPAFGVGDEP